MLNTGPSIHIRGPHLPSNNVVHVTVTAPVNPSMLSANCPLDGLGNTVFSGYVVEVVCAHHAQFDAIDVGAVNGVNLFIKRKEVPRVKHNFIIRWANYVDCWETKGPDVEVKVKGLSLTIG